MNKGKITKLLEENKRLRNENHALSQFVRTFLRGGDEAAFLRQTLLYKPEFSAELMATAAPIINEFAGKYQCDEKETAEGVAALAKMGMEQFAKKCIAEKIEESWGNDSINQQEQKQ